MHIPFTRRRLLGGISVLGAGLLCPDWVLAASQLSDTRPEDVRAIAHQAWIYAYPMLMHYQTLQKQALNASGTEYVGGFNRFRHYSQLFTPNNRDIVTPNNDTPYS